MRCTPSLLSSTHAATFPHRDPLTAPVRLPATHRLLLLPWSPAAPSRASRTYASLMPVSPHTHPRPHGPTHAHLLPLPWQHCKGARWCSHACLLVHSWSVDPSRRLAHLLTHTSGVCRDCPSAIDVVAQVPGCLRDDVLCLYPEWSLVKCWGQWD